MTTNFYCNTVDYGVYPTAQLAAAGNKGQTKSFPSYPAAQKWLNSGHSDKHDDTIDFYPIGTATAAKYYLPDLSINKNTPLPNGTLERNSLRAVILGLQDIAANKKKFAASKKLIVVHVESLYIAGCMFTWAPAWKARRGALLNADLVAQLWETMDASPFPIRIDYIHMKGSDPNVALASR